MNFRDKITGAIDKITGKGLENLEKTTEEMKNLTVDEINKAPLTEVEPQTKMSKEEVEHYDAPVIKPTRSFPAHSKPSSKEKKERERGWELVKCIAENVEIYGEKIEFWLNKYLGDPTHFWEIPVNKPIYLPRFVAEHLATRTYHRFKMVDRSGRSFMEGSSSGEESLVVRETLARVTCKPAGFEFS